MMDATHIRATQAAAGAKKKGEKGEQEPPHHALGRSRGGLTTKILLCDAEGHPQAENGVREDQDRRVIKDYMPNAISWNISLAGLKLPTHCDLV